MMSLPDLKDLPYFRGGGLFGRSLCESVTTSCSTIVGYYFTGRQNVKICKSLLNPLLELAFNESECLSPERPDCVMTRTAEGEVKVWPS